MATVEIAGGRRVHNSMEINTSQIFSPYGTINAMEDPSENKPVVSGKPLHQSEIATRIAREVETNREHEFEVMFTRINRADPELKKGDLLGAKNTLISWYKIPHEYVYQAFMGIVKTAEEKAGIDYNKKPRLGESKVDVARPSIKGSSTSELKRRTGEAKKTV